MISQRPKKKSEDNSSVSCAECSKATLMQWGDDPLIADCAAHRCREVACHRKTCKDFEAARHLPKPIKRFTKYAGLQGK